MKKHRVVSVCFGILALAWIYVLFFLSGQSGTDSGTLSLKVARMIIRWLPWLNMGPADFEPILRKIAHFCVFAMEGFLMGISLICALGYAKGALLAAAICVPMAVANEFHQRFSIGRSCEFRDMMIDSGGALTGIVAVLAIAAIFSLIAKRRQRHKSRALQ